MLELDTSEVTFTVDRAALARLEGAYAAFQEAAREVPRLDSSTAVWAESDFALTKARRYLAECYREFLSQLAHCEALGSALLDAADWHDQKAADSQQRAEFFAAAAEKEAA